MTREFKLPDPGEGIHEAEILEVLVKEGDEVEEGQNILVVETDKASLEIPAPEAGVIEKIHVASGDTASVGEILVTFADAGDTSRNDEADDEEKAASEQAESKSDAEEEDEQPADSEESEESDDGHADKPKDEQSADRPDDEDTKSEDENQDDENEDDAIQDDDGESPDKEKEKERAETKTDQSDGDDAEDADEEDQSEASGDDEEDRRARDSSSDETSESEASESEASEKDADDTPDRKQERKAVKSVPATRRLARELGVDLHDVKPTGSHGRITDDDVREAAGLAEGSHPQLASLPDFEQWGEVEREPLRSIRRATAERMTAAWREIPHVTHMDAVEIDFLEAFRQRHNSDGADDTDQVTLTGFILKAVAAALREHPRFNASLDPRTSEIIYRQYCNIGVAVATDRGLLVPVVRDVDRKSVLEITAELSDLTERARQGKSSKEDLSGGGFTITNIGPLGGRAFTPIVNWPEVGILGLGKARYEPIAHKGTGSIIEFSAKLMLPLCLAFDHRVNDGADAAQFMSSLIAILRDPDQFVLAA